MSNKLTTNDRYHHSYLPIKNINVLRESLKTTILSTGRHAQQSERNALYPNTRMCHTEQHSSSEHQQPLHEL